MQYRNATVSDIPQIEDLQKRYHVSFISLAEKKNGFITTLFTTEQLKELIKTENGISLACDGEMIAAYAMAGSWQYWNKWPLFQQMISDLPNTEYLGQTLSIENSYQYGPVCIDKDYRGMGVLQELFAYSARQMNARYRLLITFINHINERSFKAHTQKVGMEVIKSFAFDGNNYYELGYDTARALTKETTDQPT